MSVRVPAAARPRQLTRRKLVVLAAAVGVAVPLVQAPAPEAQAASWKLAFSDNFTGHRVNQSKWGIFNGGNGGARSRQNVTVRDGKMILRTRRINGVWKGAGVSAARGNVQTYGKYQIRVRFDRGRGVRVAGLLWPANGQWPPEVDFFEIPATSTNRTVNTITNHYGSRRHHRMQHGSYRGDFTKWHVIGLEWTPSSLRFTMDGRTKAVMRHHVPRQKMWFGIQTRAGGAWSGIRPGRGTGQVDLELDWVKIYRRR